MTSRSIMLHASNASRSTPFLVSALTDFKAVAIPSIGMSTSPLVSSWHMPLHPYPWSCSTSMVLSAGNLAIAYSTNISRTAGSEVFSSSHSSTMCRCPSTKSQIQIPSSDRMSTSATTFTSELLGSDSSQVLMANSVQNSTLMSASQYMRPVQSFWALRET